MVTLQVDLRLRLPDHRHGRRHVRGEEVRNEPLDARWSLTSERTHRVIAYIDVRDRPEFMAIMFRNLLILESLSADVLGTVAQMRAYADAAWERYRDGADRFQLPGQGCTLLSQSGMVQILALLAWAPQRYGLLA